MILTCLYAYLHVCVFFQLFMDENLDVIIVLYEKIDLHHTRATTVNDLFVKNTLKEQVILAVTVLWLTVNSDFIH